MSCHSARVTHKQVKAMLEVIHTKPDGVEPFVLEPEDEDEDELSGDEGETSAQPSERPSLARRLSHSLSLKRRGSSSPKLTGSATQTVTKGDKRMNGEEEGNQKGDEDAKEKSERKNGKVDKNNNGTMEVGKEEQKMERVTGEVAEEGGEELKRKGSEGSKTYDPGEATAKKIEGIEGCGGKGERRGDEQEQDIEGDGVVDPSPGSLRCVHKKTKAVHGDVGGERAL